MKYRQITPQIHHLEFPNQVEAAKAMLRFQEHYESPQFKGKIFTLEEFKKWYTANSPNGKLTGKFTYYMDWNGFNFTDKVVKPFRDGDFDPLSKREQDVLDALHEATGKFYVVATHVETDNLVADLTHEVAHALFYTNPEYKKAIRQVFEKYPCNDLRKALVRDGYSEKVLDDEIQAYCVDGEDEYPLPASVTKVIRKIFDQFKPDYLRDMEA